MNKSNKAFYPKLAVDNIKKNKKAYIPYLLTCIGTIIMFYDICYLVVVKDMGHLSDSGSLRQMLLLGAFIIGIFSAIFLIYTNSFLIKQRKKEFGLFNILGMEKRHLAKIMFYESLFISLISLVIGIVGGIVLSKLMILLLLKILNFDVIFGFEIPMTAIVATFLLFSGIFLLNLIFNILQVYLSKPIELLKGSNVGEREPKSKWISTIAGLLSLGAGYYIALTTENAIAALNIFFLAVLLVMIGTHLLFKAGSVVLLKSFRKNRNYYYKTNHFISISGMIYRMKQNAAGLANICILSTAVIITLSTTISMYVGVEDVLRTRYPRNIILSASNISEESGQKIDEIINDETTKAGLKQENIIKYRSMGFVTGQDGSKFSSAESQTYSDNNLALLVIVTQDDYNKIENQSISLQEGETLLYTSRGDIPENNITLNNVTLTIKERLKSFQLDGETQAILSNSYYLVVDNISTIEQIYHSIEGNNDMPELSYYYGFDLNSDSEDQVNIVNSLQNEINKANIDLFVDGAESSKASFYAIYGGLFFLGLFIGLLFIMATVLIIYYKQIAEGFDDKTRYEIMQKVGLSHKEIKKSIHSQIVTVFFLPLVTSIIHVAFAFKVMTKLLSIFNLTNIALFAMYTVITILVFAVFYTIVYSLTAKTYYKIVR